METSVFKSRRCGSAYNVTRCVFYYVYDNVQALRFGMQANTLSRYIIVFWVVAKVVVHSRFFANYGGYFDDDTIETIWIILMSK